jgi:hypothetical protein
MAIFDKPETDEAKLWLNMSKADPDGKDHPILRKAHKKTARSMGGVITFFGKYTEPTTGPSASDATSITSTALPLSHRATRAAVEEQARTARF